MPTPTDLVTDLPADFEVFGQAVDTQMKTNADAATQKATLTTKGDLYAASAASTPARLAVGTNGQVLTADSTAATGVAWAAPSTGAESLGFTAGKNKIINGDFGIWQRGTTTSTNAAYIADRFKIGFSGTGTTQTMSQQTFTPGTAPVAGYEGTYFARNVVVGGTGTSSLVVMQQPVEDVRTFAGQTVTLSFWAKAASGTPSIGLDLFQEFGSGGSGTVSNGGTKVTISTSWARYSATISLASISGKTIGTNSLLGVRLWFSSGSDYNSLNGTLGLQSGTFDIWGVQVEAGSTMSDFQTASASIGGELALCQRYYYRQTGSNYSSYGQGAAYSTTGAWLLVQHPVTMRKAPTVIEYSTLCLEFYGVSATALTALSIDSGANNPTVSLLVADVASGLTQYRPYRLANNANSSGYFAVDAEL
jgi:hypothetical protein